jgi:lipopolysaccharide export system protein LptA|tara:strand:+ start:34 stop:273 length:240 start_codon:yes stop_codon:yes gene_type:complete
MSTLKANIVESTAVTTEFKDVITANGDKQWVDSYGIIKTNRDTISENVVIPSGSNGLSSGPVTIASGYTVTVNGEWAIV